MRASRQRGVLMDAPRSREETRRLVAECGVGSMRDNIHRVGKAIAATRKYLERGTKSERIRGKTVWRPFTSEEREALVKEISGLIAWQAELRAGLIETEQLAAGPPRRHLRVVG